MTHDIEQDGWGPMRSALDLAEAVNDGWTRVATLAAAQEELDANLDKGTHCPCCGQWAQRYKRKLNAQMARVLIKMHQASTGKAYWEGVWDGEYVNLPQLLMHHHADEAKLAYWGLIEESYRKRGDGGRAGWWKVTERGHSFAQDILRVPKYALVYNGALMGLDGPEVGIRDALGDHFDYSELMRGGTTDDPA